MVNSGESWELFFSTLSQFPPISAFFKDAGYFFINGNEIDKSVENLALTMCAKWITIILTTIILT